MILQTIFLMNEFLFCLMGVILFYRFAEYSLQHRETKRNIVSIYSILFAGLVFYGLLLMDNSLFIIVTIFILSNVYLHLCFRGKMLSKSITSITFLLTMGIVTTIITSFFVVILSVRRAELNTYGALRVYFVLVMMISVFVLVEISRLIIRKQKQQVISNSRSYNVFFGLIFTTLLLLFGSFLLVKEVGTSYLIQYMITVLGMLAVIILILVTHHFRNKNKLVESEILLKEAKIREVSEFKEVEHNLNVMKTKHDLKNHMISLRYLVENELIEDALGYIENMESMDTFKNHVDTNNQIVNAVLNSKISEYPDIQFRITTNIETFIVKPHLLSVLLGNIIDNAIEAVKKIPQEERVIEVVITENDQYGKIIVKNPFDGNLKIKNGKLYSLKRDDSAGLGLLSVKNILDESGGKMKYSYENNTFKIVLLIKK